MCPEAHKDEPTKQSGKLTEKAMKWNYGIDPSSSGLSVVALVAGDLMVPGVAERAVEEAATKLGGIDGLVLNHA